MRYILEHTVLYDGSFSWVHFASILVLVAVVFYCASKVRKMKEETKNLEDALSAKYADESMKPDDVPPASVPEK